MKDAANITPEEMKQDRMNKGLIIFNELENLTWEAQEECVFGEPMNLPLFQKCMKAVWEYFSSLDKTPRTFDPYEVQILAQLYAYAWLPVAMKTDHSALFEASTHAASSFAKAIMYGKAYVDVQIESGKMVDHYFFPETETDYIAEYDFEKGDLGAFVKLVEMGYWD